jgi:hypothetical protein
MNKIFKQWIHYAALAAEAFTGQAHWYETAGEPAALPARSARKTPCDADFGALHAAD